MLRTLFFIKKETGQIAKKMGEPEGTEAIYLYITRPRRKINLLFQTGRGESSIKRSGKKKFIQKFIDMKWCEAKEAVFFFY